MLERWKFSVNKGKVYERKLQESSTKLFKLFAGDQVKGNANKCHLIVSTRHAAETQFGELVIKDSTSEKLVIKIDNKLNFNEHIKRLYKKANSKLKAIARVTTFMNVERKTCIKYIFPCTI